MSPDIFSLTLSQITVFALSNSIRTRIMAIRDVNGAEISGLARPAKLFSARPGSQLMYYKICTVQLFWKILHQKSI